MALDQQRSFRTIEAGGGGADFLFRPIPLLVGLWRQLGVEPAAKALPSDEPELFAALQSEIIPRLMIASRMPAAPVAASTGLELRGTAFNAAERKEFLDALLSDDEQSAGRLAEAQIGRGHELPTLMIELFASSARELGEMWNEDQISFVEVTVGVCRLHQIVHNLTGQPDAPADIGKNGSPSILIASAPGEQHVFGVLVASELFRQHEWTVFSETSGDPALICQHLANQRFDIAGISASHDGVVRDLPGLIKTLRRTSRNPSVKLLVGGPLFEHSPHIAREIGADGIAGRGLDAPELARKLLAM
ncbi:MAG: cobalamin-dependent protein [Hyphomonas sp.]|uniref:B12-binding domain-containing protein n=1 Tax=Hyphomonas sp. TaxID=87 RepID=UPI00349FE654